MNVCDEERTLRIRGLLEVGLSQRQVAEAVGVARGTVARIADRRDAERVERNRRAEERVRTAAAAPHDDDVYRYGDARIPIRCACGCGTRINEVVVTILEMRKMGTTLKVIAQRLGYSAGYVKVRQRQFARYAHGHFNKQRKGQTTTGPCINCGRTVTVAAGWRLKCRGRDTCLPLDLLIAKNCERYDEARAEANATARVIGDAAVGAERSRRKAIGRARGRRLTPLSTAHWRDAEAETTRWLDRLNGDGEEARALVEAQRRDERVNRIQYEPSFDAWFDDETDGTRRMASLGGVTFDREDDRWPYYAERGRSRKVRARS